MAYGWYRRQQKYWRFQHAKVCGLICVRVSIWNKTVSVLQCGYGLANCSPVQAFHSCTVGLCFVFFFQVLYFKFSAHKSGLTFDSSSSLLNFSKPVYSNT